MAEGDVIADDAKPRLPRGVRLTHNEAQGGWVLLAPERIFNACPFRVKPASPNCTSKKSFS